MEPSRRSLRYWILQGLTFCVFLLVGMFLFSGWNSSPSEIDDAAPLLTADESDLDLGTVWEQTNYQLEIPLRNRTRREVVVADLHPSCNCTTLQPRTFSLKPGQTQVVKANIDLLKSIRDDAKLQAPFVMSLDARIVRPRETVEEFVVRGIVRRALLVKPREIVLIGADEVIDGAAPPEVTLDVEPQIELQTLYANVSNRAGSARCLGPGEDGNYRVEFTPDANLPRGPVQGILLLHTFLANGEKGPSLDVPISGRVSGPVHFSPNEAVVTNRRDGGAVLGPHVVALHGRDGANWTIDGVESDCGLVRHRVIENGTRLTAFVETTGEESLDALPGEATLTVAVKSDEGRRERLLLPVQLAPYKAFFRKE